MRCENELQHMKYVGLFLDCLFHKDDNNTRQCCQQVEKTRNLQAYLDKA